MKKRLKAFKGLITNFRRENKTNNYINHHLNFESCTLTTLQSGDKAYLRPSFSDIARANEFKDAIYIPDCELTNALINYSPTTVFDIGANIGLSTLSILNCISSIKSVVAIEAEKENYSVLCKNFELWSGRQDATLQAIYGIANNQSSIVTYHAKRLPGGLSASGTFMFEACTPESTDIPSINIEFGPPVDISQLILDLPANERIIMKVDIEGGEEDLFSGDASWMQRLAFITVEVHDRFGKPSSSKNLISNLVKYDFAIYPCQDILHCYNRRILFPQNSSTKPY